MNSPPDALSPSPSTPSSGSPSPDDVGLPTPAASTGGGGVSESHSPNVLASPVQAKRRLPPSASPNFSGREGRESKSRRRERDRDSDEGSKKGGGSWEPAPAHGHGGPPSRVREELVDHAVVEFVRKSAFRFIRISVIVNLLSSRTAYGDPFDDSIFKQRNKS